MRDFENITSLCKLKPNYIGFIFWAPSERYVSDKTPKILTITQSTYDGILYNVEIIKDVLNGHIDTLHFDEAWVPHAAFHDFYKDMHAIGENRPRAKDTIIFSTQSIHKLLAGISQASQILVQDSETKRFDHNIFNEAYLMHSSTSPQYSIIASLDTNPEKPMGRLNTE